MCWEKFFVGRSCKCATSQLWSSKVCHLQCVTILQEKKEKKKEENTLIYALEGVAHCFVVAFAVCRSNLAALRPNLIAKSSILV